MNLLVTFLSGLRIVDDCPIAYPSADARIGPDVLTAALYLPLGKDEEAVRRLGIATRKERLQAKAGEVWKALWPRMPRSPPRRTAPPQ